MLAQPIVQLNPMDSYFHSRNLASFDKDFAPQQYAIPARRVPTGSKDSSADGLSYAEHELLRQRKTPHGRLLEEHEVSTLDRHMQLPASKHVVLSRSPRDHHLSRFGSQDQTSHGLTDDHAYKLKRPTRVRSGFWSYPVHHQKQLSNGGIVGGIDSVLQQAMPVPSTQRFYYAPGSNVPTVLPATLHAPLGPTVSPDQQFYGPYWPDGTFSPYRPASVRDSRYFDRDIGFESIRPPVDNTSNDHRTLRRPGRLPAFGLKEDLHDAREPTRDFREPGPSSDSARHHSRSTSSAHQTNRVYGDFVDSSAVRSDATIKPINPTANTELRPGIDAERLAFRDKTFTWAHRVYVDLLAQIHRGNRLGRHHSGPTSHMKPANKPAIYPKPPRRSGSHFSDIISPSSSTDPIERIHRDQPRPSHYHGHDRNSQQASGYGSDHRPSRHDASDERNLFHPQDRHPESYAPNYMPSQPRMPDAMIQGNDPYNHQVLPPFAAVSALDTIELLCQEAHSPWTDGMLLAGCLAYGLSDYPKALFWYQSILNQDPQHVEAISNLAAAYLALNRKDDALRCWNTAVKLRPNYFEAVEHLIGLLCGSHRTREAVEVIEYVQTCLKLSQNSGSLHVGDTTSDGESDTVSRTSSSTLTSSDVGLYDFDVESRHHRRLSISEQQTPGCGSSGYAVGNHENGRLLALIHAKGNMLYSLGHNLEAAAAFEDAILIATGQRRSGIRGLIEKILQACVSNINQCTKSAAIDTQEPILLSPERAQQTAQRLFPSSGDLPGLESVPRGLALKAAIATTSNSLLSLAKIYQDGMGSQTTSNGRKKTGTREILALYYLSLSLQRSPSTANNVGILLASVQHTTAVQVVPQCSKNQIQNFAGVVPGSGIALALAYYNYGLNIDGKHAHLYTNLGSLLKDLGQLPAAIKMYEIAVSCDGNFDIALANLANAVKDQGRIADAITYYRRAVQANPDFAEAVCGLATALNSVCNWYGRGGVYADNGHRDRIHVDDTGMMHEGRCGSGWMNQVVQIVDRQLKDGERWGMGILNPSVNESLSRQLVLIKGHLPLEVQNRFTEQVRGALLDWSGKKWEGSRVVRLLERATRYIGWQWYRDNYYSRTEYPLRRYARPTVPDTLAAPTAPTVLPFHTFTTPLSAKQVRQISQRNALRISVSTMRSAWLPPTVYRPPAPPAPCLNVGYVSSDFNNHPLAHLMQSIFGLHDPTRVRAFCYATTTSDESTHRLQIEREAPVFHDASTWGVERLVNQIVEDGIHILVNLNGYTRGARNEVFAARPAPIHMSFMGFAGTLGAEWCDYVYADPISVLPQTLSRWRRNFEIEDRLNPNALTEDDEGWVYAENVIFAKSTFFCVDHKQSAPDADHKITAQYDRARLDGLWEAEQQRRWKLREELFPSLSETAVVLGNFNQLYKIDPSTFRMYLRILSAIPNSILWLLRFPDVGEQNLLTFAREWAGPDIAARIVFTDVAPKGAHITRASVVDLFLDTPECNAHTTAADVIWSGTPIVTWARWEYKMCSRMASSIVASALPEGRAGDDARRDLLVQSEQEYEQRAIELASGLKYPTSAGKRGMGRGRLVELRRMLWEGRWTSRLFDTQGWVRNLETAYWEAWRKWENGEGGDIWL